MKILIAFMIICGVVAGQQKSMFTNDEDRIMFPGPSGRSLSFNSIEPSPLSKSLLLAKQLDELNSIDEFLHNVVGIPKDEIDMSFSNRFGDFERASSVNRTTPAKCEPELHTVSFTGKKHDPSVIYFPLCTRVKRCGGCCSHSLTSCQPTKTEFKNFEVVVTKIETSGQFSQPSTQIIPLEVHLSCKCLCTIQEKHCTKNQSYRPDECRCICTNVDEESKCRAKTDIKLWDPTACSCLCRNTLLCNTGFYFDQNECRCREIQSSQWIEKSMSGGKILSDSNNRNFPSLRIPVDAEDPRRKHKDEPNS